MKLLTYSEDYVETMKMCKTELNDKDIYDGDVIFHAYWNGQLNEKHFYSIKSCYYFNVHLYKGKGIRKIILWIENNTSNDFNERIAKYAEIKEFNLESESANTILQRVNKKKLGRINYNDERMVTVGESNIVRFLLLYKYGGCWFDLDVYFLRSFDPLFTKTKNDMVVYQWPKTINPNGAIFVSLTPQSSKLREAIIFILNRDLGFSFLRAKLIYQIPLNFLVLPCSWFDGGWIDNPYKMDFLGFMTKTDIDYSFDNFFTDCLCFHWHNQWNRQIETNSPMDRLNHILDANILD